MHRRVCSGRLYLTQLVASHFVLAAIALPCQAVLNANLVGSGFHLPVDAASPPGDSSRLFVLEQFEPGSLTTASIKILDLDNCNGVCTTNPTPFLTIEDLDTNSNDFAFQGTQSLAFHPDYANNGLFYVSLVGANEDTYVREYQTSAENPNVADPNPVRTILTIDKNPGSRHNAAWLGFGPNDGYLYMTTGDSGGENDPHQNAQNLNNLNAKLLRIDVNGDDFPADTNANYAIPPANPFVGQAGDDAIWAYGFRNPWRASFDRATGDLYIGDVGAGQREEVNVQPASHAGGINYGWRLREGTIATPGVGGPLPGATDPIYDYTHGPGASQGFSVTGGYVYRGPIAEIQGQYFFADFVTERVWSLRYDNSDPSTHNGTNFDSFVDWTDDLQPLGTRINQIVSFAEDGAGNLYLLDLSGEVFRIEPDPPEGIWGVDASGDWHRAANWAHANVPNGSDKSAVFGSVISRDRTVFTDIDVTVSAITFEDVHSYAIMGGGRVLLEADGANAMLSVLEGHHEFQTKVEFRSHADADIAASASLTFNDEVNLAGHTVTKTGDGALIVNSRLAMGGGSLIIESGVISGSASIIGDVNNNAGALSPGNSPGEIMIDGDYTQGPDGALLMELGGNEGAAPHDRLSVSGHASLAGQLHINLLDGFQPAAGTALTIFDFASMDGSFDAILLPALDGRAWDTSLLYTNGILRVVPEPQAMSLALCALWIGSARRPKSSTTY